MTELNPETDPAAGTEPEAADAGIDWPTFTQGEAPDPAVDVLLERLGALPSEPVSRHGEVYGKLHDDLMEALNEDVTGQPNSTGDAAR